MYYLITKLKTLTKKSVADINNLDLDIEEQLTCSLENTEASKACGS